MGKERYRKLGHVLIPCKWDDEKNEGVELEFSKWLAEKMSKAKTENNWEIFNLPIEEE